MIKRQDYTIIQKAEAARAYINRVPHSAEEAKRLELEAFMSIFHPKVYTDRKRMFELRQARHKPPA